ncbi:MAG: hypothetical protein PVG75_11575 [Thioalkalispiraceae bacterium]
MCRDTLLNMKQSLRKLFWFILVYFERDDEPYTYKPLNRTILIIVGSLFTVLAVVSVYFSDAAQGYGFLIPALVFFAVGLVCLVVGLLGSDKAVSRIWGNR